MGIQIAYELVGSGWAKCTIRVDDACATVTASYLSDALDDLASALAASRGGTDINSVLAYCEKQIENRAKTHLMLTTDLYEEGDAKSMLARAAIKQSGVNFIVLLAL